MIAALKKFHPNDIIEITNEEIIYIISAHIKSRKVSEAKVLSMLANGLGPTEIGEKLNCSKQLVNSIREKRNSVLKDSK